MVSRIASTVILWLVLIASLWYFGAHAAVALLTILTVLTLHEFYGMTARIGARPFTAMGLVAAAVMIAGPYYLEFFNEDAAELAALIPGAMLALVVVASCGRALGERDAANRVESIGATVLGVLYVPFMLQFLVRLLMRDDVSGNNLVLCVWVVAVTKFCDVGALLTGMAIGRHKMAPVISPKKTWEGAVGGVLVSAAIGAGIAFFAQDKLPEKFTPLAAALVAVPLAIIGIVSDLIESVLKRRADTKDAGHVIPGIGGAFDLTDSLILTAPVAYLIFLVFFHQP